MKSKSLVALSVSLGAVAIVGFSLSILIFTYTFLDGDWLSRPVCFKTTCAKCFIEAFEQSFSVAKATIDLMVGLATAGGIIVALLSYLNTSSNAALTNHIAHFSIFQNYISIEVSKRKRVSPSSIDTLVLYNLIFSTSRSGKTDISSAYIDFSNKLNALICESNNQAMRAVSGSFRYKQHQVKIVEHLKKAGIELYLSPRNDFFEMEDQVFSLIDRINQSFCYSDSVPPLVKKAYI